MNLMNNLRGLLHEQELEGKPTDWGPDFEERLISLLLEKPDLFSKNAAYLGPKLFTSIPCMFVMLQIADSYQAHRVVPSREILREQLAKQLTADDPWEKIFAVVESKPSPRDVPFVTQELDSFIATRILSQLRSDEMIELMVSNDAPLIATKVNEIYAEYETFCRGEAKDSFSATELVAGFPQQRPAVVDGFFREGQIANIVSSSKVGKSWLMYGLALSVASGRPWFGHDTQSGRVLLVDNELQKEDLSFRLRCVSDKMGAPLDALDIWTLRDTPQSLSDLRPRLKSLGAGQYKLIILDAKYKLVEADASENDNADEARFYAMLSEIAGATQSAIALVHHSTKGDQSEKRVTDVGSGAGTQSRAADCHIVLREHEDEGKVVLDAAIRSFKPVKPHVLYFQWPLWLLDKEADPAKLATKQGRDQKARDQEGCSQVLNHLRDTGAATPSKLRAGVGISADRLAKLLRQLVAAGTVTENPIKVRGNPTFEYDVVGTLSAETCPLQH
ncbi:AAA family ATPase [Lacipirellula sp.]|uniref:AAA family ATPase n=1 Tax=Lacipirellula sp. TaxID=2691419 RepID=UPI003D12D727